MSKTINLAAVEAAAAQQQLNPAEEHRLKKENLELRRQLREALERNLRDQAILDLFDQSRTPTARQSIQIPKWVLPSRQPHKHLVMPMLNVADWHFDEIVDPAQVQYRNAYNREIAERRYRQLWENTIKVGFSYVQGFRYPGIVVTVLGDMFSGNIHDELRQTNADVLLSSLLHWVGPTVAGLRLLADHFGHVWANGWLAGNHGRMTHKPIAKNRVRDNVDWLFAQIVKRELEQAGEKRITFTIAESHKHLFQVFNTRFVATHGDEARGGSGIAGLLSPLLIAAARMKKIYDFDIWMLGHWHHQAAFRGIRASGTGKGYDEYALIQNFEYQEPMQDFFLINPFRRAEVAQWPIFVDKAPALPEAVPFKA